jgi:NADH-quinone oxidoreductase E subunit
VGTSSSSEVTTIRGYMGLSFSEQGERSFQAILQKYPADKQKAALIPTLCLAQKEWGYLSPEAMEYVAGRLDVAPAEVQNTATFYTMLLKEPVGRYHIQVCTNLSCFLRGSDELMHQCEKKLGIHHGETTADGVFTLNHVECLASCGTAPMMQVNDTYYENLTPARVDALIDGWRKTARSDAP